MTVQIGATVHDEDDRIEAIRRYDILDTPPDGSFDRITSLAAALLNVPIAIVSIVDTDRIWFKSAHGVDGVAQIDREPGLCASAILQDDLYLVEDARHDPRTLSNPLVAGEFGLQFYAGFPLKVGTGQHNFGTLCVIDREPRTLTDAETRILRDLTALVVDELELRLAARHVEASVAMREQHMRDNQRRASQLNDDIVQALAVAKLGMQLDRPEQALEYIDRALEASKSLLADLVSETGYPLRREQPSLADIVS